jgi:carbamoyl-phosphate synthase large subunit
MAGEGGNVRPLRILLTACGCPGASTLIRMLKNIKERRIEIIGADMDDEAVGRFLADDFVRVPPATDSDYVPAMLGLVERLKPDVLFPESSVEVYPLSLHKAEFERLGTVVPVSDPEAIAVASDKYRMYEVLREGTDLRLPAYRSPRNLEEFLVAARELGYPDRAVCFKPHVAKGSRGFRILDARVDRRDLLLNYKPNSRYMSLDAFVEIFQKAQFPDLLIMEYVEGMEYTTDPIALNGETLFCTTKTVEEARWGVVVRSELVDRPELLEQTRRILEVIPLSYNVNLQFIENRLIEINPRLSSFVYQDDLIPPYLAVKLALGEISPEEVRQFQSRVEHGRRLVGYFDRVYWNPRE